MLHLQVLGTGCPKCEKLAAVVTDVAEELGVPYRLEKVTDIRRIIACGVMMTPALMVDGTVKVVGKIPSVDELKSMLTTGSD